MWYSSIQGPINRTDDIELGRRDFSNSRMSQFTYDRARDTYSGSDGVKAILYDDSSKWKSFLQVDLALAIGYCAKRAVAEREHVAGCVVPALT